MAIDEDVWTSDATYALGTFKLITWTSGTWPLQEGVFASIRFGIAVVLGLGVLVSLLMEIQLSCGSTDENLDFFGVMAATIRGLTKLIFTKIHRENLETIISSALKDWSSIVDGSSAKDIMRKYARRTNLVCRIYIGSGLVIVTTMMLDALPVSSSSSSNETISSEELVKRIPLRTMCVFGNMSTSAYWTVFILQGVQLLNIFIIDSGNDSFFFGIAMHLCGQFDALAALYDELLEKNGEQRDWKMKKFVERHSYLLDLARRLQDTFDNILVVVLMADGLHICLLGIQIILLSRDNEMIPMVKSTLSFLLILGNLFLYSYTGDYLSTLSQNVQEVVYTCPWYEFPPNIVRNLMFVMARAHVPFRLTAGRFYTMNMDSFKEILKASFSYFSVLRIMFEE
ncbi:hypothetical protein KPH14_004141 [Odynerus spinipes]|uniref:Odorant receptor n=1 Tax=Odynerus spinipes TaxID=1348599 RepID=A0AAD9VV21_9HYME|nr:hypothetical protein KPH14_004141 [Odynerus spinipes]